MKTPKLGLVWCPRRSIEATYLPIMRCPVYKRRDSNPGSRMELENRVGDDKGKGTSGDPTRLKVPMHRSGAHCLVVAVKRGKARRAKGAGHPRRDGVNGQPEELLVLAEAGRLPRGGTSRMNREIHVRICGGLGVQIPGSTRRGPGPPAPQHIQNHAGTLHQVVPESVRVAVESLDHLLKSSPETDQVGKTNESN